MAVEAIPIAIEVIKTAGSLATIANFVRGWLKSGKTEIQERDRKEVLEAVNKVKVEAVPSSKLTKILARISERHLKPIVERVKKADEDYVIIVQGGSMVDVKKAHGMTAFEVCALLKLILKHNDGELPEDEYLLELWDSFSCETVRTVFD